jgi:hypothetical protein
LNKSLAQAKAQAATDNMVFLYHACLEHHELWPYGIAPQDSLGLIPRIGQLYNTLKTCFKHVPSAILHHDVTTIDLEKDDDDDVIDSDVQASKQLQSMRETYVKELKSQSFRMIKINYEAHAFHQHIKSSAGGGVRKDRLVAIQ